MLIDSLDYACLIDNECHVDIQAPATKHYCQVAEGYVCRPLDFLECMLFSILVDTCLVNGPSHADTQRP